MRAFRLKMRKSQENVSCPHCICENPTMHAKITLKLREIE